MYNRCSWPTNLADGCLSCVFTTYTETKHIYDDGIGTAMSLSSVLFAMLIVLMLPLSIGFRANAGLNSGINTTAKSFPESVVSGILHAILYWEANE